MHLTHELKTIFLAYLRYLNTQKRINPLVNIIQFFLSENFVDNSVEVDFTRLKLKDFSKLDNHIGCGALFLLGICYRHGFGAEKNVKKAFEFFERGAERGCSYATYNLAHYYENGIEIDKNLKKAFELYQKAAEQGHAEAMNNVAYCYEEGIGVSPNLKKAVEFYRKAGNLGLPAAQNKLGCFYQSGMEGIEINLKKAVEQYQLAADQDFPYALYNLGLCYEEGTGVQKDAKKAFELFHKAAIKNHAMAQNKVGFCYYSGKIVQCDLKKAIEFFQLSADQGYAEAMDNLSYCYKHGVHVEKNEKLAFEFCKKAADKGFPSSLINLGFYYLVGTVVPKNVEAAFDIFQKLAKKGNSEAQTALGHCYQNGFGVAIDLKKAVEWYKLGAEQDETTACIHLSYCYLNNLGVERDIEKAFAFARKAADKGNDIAKFHLAKFYCEGIYVDKNPKKGLSYLEEAAKAGVLNAQFELGRLYATGEFVTKNLKMAKEIYEQCALNGHKEAQLQLADLLLNNEEVYDVKEAIHYCELAYQQDSLEACLKLAVIYEASKHQNQNLHLALKYYTEYLRKELHHLAIKDNNKEAMEILSKNNQDPKVLLKLYEKYKTDPRTSLNYISKRIEFLRALLEPGKVVRFFQGHVLPEGYSALTKELASLLNEYEVDDKESVLRDIISSIESDKKESISELTEGLEAAKKMDIDLNQIRVGRLYSLTPVEYLIEYPNAYMESKLELLHEYGFHFVTGKGDFKPIVRYVFQNCSYSLFEKMNINLDQNKKLAEAFDLSASEKVCLKNKNELHCEGVSIIKIKEIIDLLLKYGIFCDQKEYGIYVQYGYTGLNKTIDDIIKQKCLFGKEYCPYRLKKMKADKGMTSMLLTAFDLSGPEKVYLINKNELHFESVSADKIKEIHDLLEKYDLFVDIEEHATVIKINLGANELKGILEKILNQKMIKTCSESVNSCRWI